MFSAHCQIKTNISGVAVPPVVTAATTTLTHTHEGIGTVARDRDRKLTDSSNPGIASAGAVYLLPVL